MISKPVILRRGEYRYRILEMYLKLIDQELKTIMYLYRLLYKDLMLTANQKSVIDIHMKKKKESKHNPKNSHQIKRGEQKRKGRIKT